MCRDTKLREERRFSEEEAYDKCERICTDMNYKPVGFPDGYINQQSYFEYECPKHGNHKVLFNNFVIHGRRCPLCWEDRRKMMCSGFYGYYPERKHEQDFLYVIDFDGKFIKVGRSFDVDERIKGLRHESKFPIKKIHKLRVFTATHQEIYNLEQKLHDELRERNFQHSVDWSTECFENESLFILNKLLDISGLEEIT